MAKKYSFLGKSIPKRPTPQPQESNHFLSWSLFVIIPLLIAASVLYYLFANMHTVDPASLTQTNQNRHIVLGSIPYRPIEAQLTANEPSQTNTSACDVAIGSGKLDANKVFPIIPSELSIGGQCPPTQWNLNVIRYFSYKLLTAANWLAATLAVIFTVWAGVLYIGGFANEQNTKKAKAILIGAYAGLLIVILARTILYGSIQATLNSNYNPGVTPVDSSDIIK